jgi:hypothetical protein
LQATITQLRQNYNTEREAILRWIELCLEIAEIADDAMAQEERTHSERGTPTKSGYKKEMGLCADMADRNVHHLINGGTTRISITIQPGNTAEKIIQAISDHYNADPKPRIQHVWLARFWAQKAEEYRSHRPDLANLCLFRAQTWSDQLQRPSRQRPSRQREPSVVPWNEWLSY